MKNDSRILRCRPKGQVFTQPSATNPLDGFQLKDMVSAAGMGIPLSQYHHLRSNETSRQLKVAEKVLTQLDFENLPENVYLDFADLIQEKLDIADMHFDKLAEARSKDAERGPRAPAKQIKTAEPAGAPPSEAPEEAPMA